MQNQNSAEDRSFILLILFFAIIFIVLPMFYAANATIINSFILNISSAELRIFARFSEDAALALHKIQTVDPAALSWEQTSNVLDYTGTWIRWPFALILCLCGVIALNLGRIEKLIRVFTMSKLIRQNVEMFPCLTPILDRGKYLIEPESFDSGAWKIARSPIQFAVENSLLLSAETEAPYQNTDVFKKGLADEFSKALGNSIIDREQARVTFIHQLGEPFTEVDELSPERRALAAVFAAYANGDKESAIDLLDEISLSYSEPFPQKKTKKSVDTPDTPPVPFVQIPELEVTALLEKHKHVFEDDDDLQKHAYQLTWFTALLVKARKKGILACAQMLWVRPIDRSLWSVLSQTGGRTAWVEGYAAWSHYLNEEKQKKKLITPHVDGAVEGLYCMLDEQGWLKSINKFEQEEFE